MRMLFIVYTDHMSVSVSNEGQAAVVRRRLLRHARVPGLPPRRARHRHLGGLLPALPRLRAAPEALPLRGGRPRPRLPRFLLAVLRQVYHIILIHIYIFD